MKLTLKSLLIIATVVAGSLVVKAQEQVKVDLNSIEVDMAMNPARYNSLLDRFIANDSTLTNEEVVYLYLGQGFDPQYDPYKAFPMITKAYDDQDYATAASLSEAVVDENPLSLDLIVMGLVSATRDANLDLAIKLHNRLDMVVNGIVSTGTGTSALEPFYVASTTDLRQFLRNVLGIQEVVEQTTVGNGDVEAWKIKFPDSEREHILYFNNSLEHRYDESHKK